MVFCQISSTLHENVDGFRARKVFLAVAPLAPRHALLPVPAPQLILLEDLEEDGQRVEAAQAEVPEIRRQHLATGWEL